MCQVEQTSSDPAEPWPTAESHGTFLWHSQDLHPVRKHHEAQDYRDASVSVPSTIRRDHYRAPAFASTSRHHPAAIEVHFQALILNQCKPSFAHCCHALALQAGHYWDCDTRERCATKHSMSLPVCDLN